MLFRFRVLLFLSALLPALAAAADPGLAPELERAFRNAGVGREAVGVYVQEASGTRVLAAANAEQAFAPASTMKLVTTNAALDLLGPTFSWKTRAYANGARSGDVLQGDLIIQGGGDPKLVLENFWLFLRRIRAAGIRDIRGNLVLDRSLFAAVDYDPAAFDGQPEKPYNAGPDALLLNFHAFQLRLAPDEATGEVRVALDPPAAGFVATPPRLTREPCGDWQSRLAPSFAAQGIRLAGTYSALCGEKSWYFHSWQTSPAEYFGAVFRQMWGELGGSLQGRVVEGASPPEARLVAQWESPALAEVIRDINKYSNNVMARQLLLSLAAETGGPPGTSRQGAQAIAAWLAGKGIKAPELVLDNGSGLSRRDRIAPRTLGRMLAAAYHAPTMPEFIASLPLVGYDGSMRRRLREQSVAGQAHIKTGSLDEVRAVAGYVLAASGRMQAVVCIVNHRNAASSRAALDAVLQWVYEHG